MERNNSWHSSDLPDSSMDQREALVEVPVAVGVVEAAGCSIVHAVHSSNKVIVGERVAVETGSALTAVIDSKVAGSKIAETH